MSCFQIGHPATVGLVQQETFLFNDTIYKNIEYGLMGTGWEHETIETKQELARQACQEAFANEFICRLPEVRQAEILTFIVDILTM